MTKNDYAGRWRVSKTTTPQTPWMCYFTRPDLLDPNSDAGCIDGGEHETASEALDAAWAGAAATPAGLLPLCAYCGTVIFNDSDSHPADPAGPWADVKTTDYDCPASFDCLHHTVKTGA